MLIGSDTPEKQADLSRFFCFRLFYTLGVIHWARQLMLSFRESDCKDFFRHSEGAAGDRRIPQNPAVILTLCNPVSDANPAKRIAAEKEEQGSKRSFRRKEEAESSGLCDGAIPPLVPPW